jgi:nitroreductase
MTTCMGLQIRTPILFKELFMKKSTVVFGVFLVSCVSLLSAQSKNDSAISTIINHFAARNYSSAAVTKAEIDLIIQAGIRAPSAANRQPWNFIVVQNQALAKKLVPQVTDGNILIVVSAAGDGKTNGQVILDCGLAVQSMYLAAQALGLGSRIYTGPIDNINKNNKEDLGIPGNASAIAVIRIGRLPADVDAVSSASSRNSADKIVTYK